MAPFLKAISAQAQTLTNPYCELLHMDTELERDTSKYIREDCQILHLFIDIFPQDGWPASRVGARVLARYMIEYYIFALLFLIFDIEALFLFPIAANLKEILAGEPMYYKYCYYYYC